MPDFYQKCEQMLK